MFEDLAQEGLFPDVFTEHCSKWICPHLNDEYLKGFLLRKVRILDVKKARINGLFLYHFMHHKIKTMLQVIDFITNLAEAQRFELWNPFGSPVFKTGAFNRSATLPE